MTRILSNTFMMDLKDSCSHLGKLLQYIHSDNTLDLEIRENYFNIYYRGGNALRVKEKSTHQFEYFFDDNYLKFTSFITKDVVDSFKASGDWNNYFAFVKQAMDFYFTKCCKEEREFQQLIVRENNYSTIANSTDYFIIDIEYDNHKNVRFDLVALEWQSDASIRKLFGGYKPRLVVMELKYGDGALKGCAGIGKHVEDFKSFCSFPQEIKEFKEEMFGVYKQKRELGLFPCLSGNGNLKDITSIAAEVKMLFLIANHDPASRILAKEFECINDENLGFVTSNFMGYGLFKENVFKYSDLNTRFKSQIHNVL